MLPVGLFMALTLWTGNEVYLYLTVAFIQMLKAFTPVITMLALFIARLEDPSLKVRGLGRGQITFCSFLDCSRPPHLRLLTEFLTFLSYPSP